MSAGRCLAIAWQNLLGVKLDEAFLPWANLMNVGVIEARVNVLLDLLDVALRVRSAYDDLCDLILRDALCGLLEVFRGGQLLRQLAVNGSGRPPFEGGLARFLLRLRMYQEITKNAALCRMVRLG
ncbi:hypothetical protein [Aggregatilinea lenta]|uniref:hypothetical protein n=1 Tax=Aggregatilinea lenta TaxID=913108 RepID=UPI000E5B8ACF|nr:hypothetical protein [Aggregatilinea lenta]